MATLIILVIAAMVIFAFAKGQKAKREQAYFQQIQRYEASWQDQIMENARKKYSHVA